MFLAFLHGPLQVGNKASGAIAAMGNGLSSGFSSGVGSVSSTISSATATTMDAVSLGWQAQAQVTHRHGMKT